MIAEGLQTRLEGGSAKVGGATNGLLKRHRSALYGGAHFGSS
jgi:hypothetical protein